MSPQLPAAPNPIEVDPPATQNQECSYHRAESRRRSARRYNPSQRYYSHHNLPKSSRYLELGYKTRIPARQQPHWDNLSRRRPELHRSNSSAGSGDQNATCLSSKLYPPEGSLLEQPANIPQMIAPSARENMFTEAMSGAFDLTKSPLWLGKKLAAPATFPEKEPWLLQNPRNPFSSDPNSHTGSSSSTTDRSQKEAIPLVQSQNQSDPMIVGFSLAQSPSTIETDEFSRLLQTIELHSRQSKGLADLVSSYLEEGGSYSDISPVVGDVNKFYTKPLRCQNQNPEGNLRLASLPGGGDSPDPPRDHRTPFRGHMIDRVDPGGPAVSVNGNQNGEEGGTTAHENPSQDGGSDVATRGNQVRNNANTQNNYTPASRTSNCTYFAMPVHELPQDPVLSTSDFGGFYDTFLPTAASDGSSSSSSSKKRLRQDIGDLCQNKRESSVGCCHQQSKELIDKPQSSEESQCNSQCRGCRPKRAKLDHFAGQSNLASQICAGHQPLKSPLSSQSCGLHHIETLPGISQSFAKTYSALVTPGRQRIYDTRQKSLAGNPPNCACRPRCSCTQPCQCGQDVADSLPNCGCRPRCLCTQPCQCGHNANVKMERGNVTSSVRQPLRTSICAFPLFQVSPQNPDLPVDEVFSSQTPQCGSCELLRVQG
ncbi:hypothetical protein EMCG_03608 [[Emmonsia] crescens]|uniref:Uncharacterized protein n=1 Tax=[Emmonsia] crescens TaxID=73230 RepID=A0A0G2J007_9EURO|nr:hypothetical protein EMCG_03608 [Emmonsia crescens UAMH 3008]